MENLSKGFVKPNERYALHSGSEVECGIRRRPPNPCGFSSLPSPAQKLHPCRRGKGVTFLGWNVGFDASLTLWVRIPSTKITSGIFDRSLFFSGVECGIRTHDLQCHKLTRSTNYANPTITNAGAKHRSWHATQDSNL